MNNPSTITTLNSQPAPTPPTRDWRARWFPEGIIVPVLLLALVSVATFSVQFGGWSSVVIPVGVIGLIASVFGMIVAKLRIADSWAHMGGFVVGIGVNFLFLISAADSLGEGWRDRIRPLVTFFTDWYLGRQSPDDHEELLISMLMGLIVWLVGYLASWTLFRRNWLMAALFLPGLLLVINLAYEPNPRPWLLGVMLALAIPLGARIHLYERQRHWVQQNLRSPLRLPGRVLTITMVLGLLITSISWQAPESWSQASVQPMLQAMSHMVTETRDSAADWVEQALGTSNGGSENAGSYTAFDDAFSVGGPLQLSDQEEVLVTANLQRAPYLTAHHYDLYTGRGWKSGIDDQFQRTGPDGQEYSPELLFRPDQGVVLSSDVTTDRVEQTIQVSPLSGQSGVMFTVDTYQSSSITSVVRMSWRALQDEPFIISPENLTELPPDIQLISSLLLEADLRGVVTEAGAQATDAALQSRIDNEVAVLHGRMIFVTWEADEDGTVQRLLVSGQLPVYDDVEAVFPRNVAASGAGGAYAVTGLTSVADDTALSSAGSDYPDWVTDRYLQLGDSVTPRTIELALEITRGTEDPYARAVRIEEWLRSNIVYDERVAAPPGDDDVVDYVLFENRRGYCEHYSSAMTVMMRALGIPARTVVGYYPGDYDAARGGFLYRQLNAHAWTEIFFPGYGWIPFEPTANRPLSDRDALEQDVLEGAEPTVAPVEPTVTPDVTPPAANEDVESTPVVNPGPPAMTIRDDGGSPSWLMPAGVAAGMGLAIGVGFWFAWTWKFRHLPPSAAFYARLVRVGKWGGVKSSRTTTPREFASSFSERLPSAGPAARRIVQVYELDQYGPEDAGEGRLATARDAWRQVRSLIPGMFLRWRK